MLRNYKSNELKSGMMCSPKSINYVKDFSNGNATVTDKNGTTWRAVKRLNAKQLEMAMTVAANYHAFNQGWDVYCVNGVTGDTAAYGEDGIEFESVQETLDFYEVKTLSQLEALQDQNEYDHASYLNVTDLETTEFGSWFYLCEGRWCRGSGAETLSWVLVEEFDQDAYDAEQAAEKREARVQVLNDRINDYKREIAVLESDIDELDDELRQLLAEA